MGRDVTNARAIEDNREAEERYENIINDVTKWTDSRRLDFWAKVRALQDEKAPEMFRVYVILTQIAHIKAVLRAYEEITDGNDN